MGVSNNQGPYIDPKVVGLLLKGHPQKTANRRNSQAYGTRTSVSASELDMIALQRVTRAKFW